MRHISSSIIIAIAVIISVIILSNTYKNRNRHNDTINVTGLGSKDFTSDLIVWSGSFSKKDMLLDKAYEALKQDREIIRNYLVGKGIAEDEIVFSSVNINRDYDYYYDNQNRRHSTFTGYNLNQNVTIQSNNVDLVEDVSRQVTDLINRGVELYSYEPQYYYTKLAELKIEMIAEATRDARVRAEQIAENSGAQLGDLRYARMGVFQIIARNSNEDYSWGGTFNTSAKEKTATITMKLQFGIK